ncbi:pentapeptide repeat-containing protein, partial [Roseovarius mucosus]|uniref:pentapeptide repeat-containing protein n=1 Tax=Roseovarius mucosus TaxID=215743 RepID=UPI003F72804A
ANLSRARMEGADLSAARMEGASLNGARMDSLTSLSAATFQGAALREVDFKKVAISAEQVNSSFGDLSVKLSKGMARPAHWPDWELDGQSFDTELRKWQADPDAYTPPPRPEG